MIGGVLSPYLKKILTNSFVGGRQRQSASVNMHLNE